MTTKTFTSLLGISFLIILTASIAWASKPGRCVLEVDGKTYISGRCNISIQKDGSFEIYDKKKNGYFAVVNISDGVGNGYWNGTYKGSRAHENLGELTRDGACWVNDRSRVCAWR